MGITNETTRDVVKSHYSTANSELQRLIAYIDTPEDKLARNALRSLIMMVLTEIPETDKEMVYQALKERN